MKKIFTIWFILFITCNLLLYAQWSNDPTVNTPICTFLDDQSNPSIISQAGGGAFISWTDNRNYSATHTDIYAQFVDSLGFLKWTADGLAVCTASGYQDSPKIINDHSGGIIIIWSDYRNNSKIYGQRIAKSGTILWDANGIELTSGGTVDDITDVGAGGFIITWSENRVGDNDIYAQKFNYSGEAQWDSNGVPICTAIGDQGYPEIVADNEGGAVITWADQRYGLGNDDIFVQRIDSAGNIQWIADGLVACGAAGRQYGPKMISDGENGAFIVWIDERSGTFQIDIYAQHVVDYGGTVWGPNGVPVCTEQGTQWYHNIISDENGGIIVTWEDDRSTNDIYAQRIWEAAPQWQINGIPICTANWTQHTPELCSDGNGGAIIVWQDDRDYDNDIYAQRVNSTGFIQWSSDGVPVCTATETQENPKLVSIESRGAIITWTDERNGSTNQDIYAQYINLQGGLSSVKDEETGGNPGNYGLFQNYPNPFNPSTRIKYSVPTFSKVKITVYDILGEKIETLVNEEKSAGTYQLTWDAERLPAGVYFYRIEAGKFRATKKMLLLK